MKKIRLAFYKPHYRSYGGANQGGSRMELWHALYLNPVTLGDLAENMLDEDYKEISYHRVGNKIMAILTFEDEGSTVQAGYLFDNKGNLLQSKMIENGKKSTLFDREEAIKNSLSKSRGKL